MRRVQAAHGGQGSGLHPLPLTLHPQRGFTLVEMLIVAVIFGGILLALFISFMMGQGTYLSSNTYIQVQEEARRALDAVGRELRGAGNVDDGLGTQNWPSTQIRFQAALGYNLTVAGCPANDICFGAQDQNGLNQCGGPPCTWRIHYYLVPGPNGTQQLVREILNGAAVQATRILANNVTVATFAYNGAAKTVTVNLQTTVQPPAQGLGGAQTSGLLQTRVRLRN